MKYLKPTKNTLYILGITFLICTAVLLIAGRFGIGGVRALVVQSGSMEPTIGTKSIVFTAPSNTYTVGDIITFKKSGDNTVLVTHRVQDIQTEGFITKGDANESADAEIVPTDTVIGKVFFNIPLVGHVISFAQTTFGFIILIIIPAVAIVYSEILSIKKYITLHFTQRKVARTK